MLRTIFSSWRPATILSLTGLLCLPVICPAAEQEVDWGPEFDFARTRHFYVAQQPEEEREEDQAKPQVRPPAREERPPSPPPRTAPSDQRPRPPAREPASRFRRTSLLASRGPLIRLARVPNMFGDFFSNGGQLAGALPETAISVDVPPVGLSRRMKIADNNKALPTDRVFFVYNHFHNALEADPGILIPRRSFSVDQYTIGLEKTFCDGLWSTEVRMPFTGGYQYAVTDFGIHGGQIGNLAVVVKRLLRATQTTAIAAGIGIDTPTGSDITGEAGLTSYALHNEAVHLLPWVGFLHTPNDRFFYQGFLEVGIAANGHNVDFGNSHLGELTEQNLLFVDLSLGYWLHRNPHATITGLAPLLELHYTTTLQDAVILSGTDGYNDLQIGNLDNRVDVLNLTFGLHTEILNQTTVSVAGVVPLRTGGDRLFDAEIQVLVNRRF